MGCFKLSQMIHSSIVHSCQDFQSGKLNVEGGEHRKKAERRQSYGFSGHICMVNTICSLTMLWDLAASSILLNALHNIKKDYS